MTERTARDSTPEASVDLDLAGPLRVSRATVTNLDFCEPHDPSRHALEQDLAPGEQRQRLWCGTVGGDTDAAPDEAPAGRPQPRIRLVRLGPDFDLPVDPAEGCVGVNRASHGLRARGSDQTQATLTRELP